MLMINGVPTEFTRISNPLHRAIIISLFSWRRAEPDDQTAEVMGWWGDSYPTVANDRIGSRLWLLARAKITNATAMRARGYIEQALEWVTEDRLASRVDVKVVRTGIERLEAMISIYRHGKDGPDVMQFDNLWSDLNGK